MKNKAMIEQLAQEIVQFCRYYREYCVEIERKEEGKIIKKQLEQKCEIGRKQMPIFDPELLVALLDAYEVTRDEEMLQEVLDVVSGGLDRLEVSAEGVKLLAYCYYYVEEEECARRAKEMLEELRRKEETGLESAEQVYRELVEQG